MDDTQRSELKAQYCEELEKQLANIKSEAATTFYFFKAQYYGIDVTEKCKGYVFGNNLYVPNTVPYYLNLVKAFNDGVDPAPYCIKHLVIEYKVREDSPLRTMAWPDGRTVRYAFVS